MKADVPVQSGESLYALQAAKARHELHSSIAHILGFSEMWLEEMQQGGSETTRSGLEFIYQAGTQMMTQINEELAHPKIEAKQADLSSLQRQLCENSVQIISATGRLAIEPSG